MTSTVKYSAGRKLYSVQLTILSSYSIGNQHNTFHKKGLGKFSVTETAGFLLMTSLSVPVPQPSFFLAVTFQ